MEYLHIKTLYIELTHRCNQHCKHCYLDGGMHHNETEMTTEQIIKIIREFKEQRGKYIIITGGEPLVRADIFDILDVIESLEIPFQFASNSLAMTQKRLEKLDSYKCLDLYFTSLLGADAQKHCNITQKDSYNNILETLSFWEKKEVPTYVQVTLAKEFIDDMDVIAEKLMAYKNSTVKFTPIASIGIKETGIKETGIKETGIKETGIKETKTDSIIDAFDSQRLLVPKSEFERFHKKVSALQQKYPKRIENSNILNAKQIVDLIADYKDEELYAMCYGFIAVRPNGDISFSCNMGNPYIFGKAYDTIKIPLDKHLMDYIDLLRKAEQAALVEAEQSIVEFDVTVDNYIAQH